MTLLQRAAGLWRSRPVRATACGPLFVGAVLVALASGAPVSGHADDPVYRYVDRDGVVHFTTDPGTIPEEYRTTVQQGGLSGPDTQRTVRDRLQEMFDFDQERAPAARGAAADYEQALDSAEGVDSGEAGGDGAAGQEAAGGSFVSGAGGQTEDGQASGQAGAGAGPAGSAAAPGVQSTGGVQVRGGQARAGIDLSQVRKMLANYDGFPLLQKLIVAAVAAFQSGFFLAVLAALIILAFLASYWRLSRIERDGATRRKGKIKAVVVSVALIGVMVGWTYPDYIIAYRELITILGL